MIVVVIALIIALGIYNTMTHPTHKDYRYSIIQPMTGIKPNPIIAPAPVVIYPTSTAIKPRPVGGIPGPAPIILPYK